MKKNISILESVDLEMDWERVIPTEVEEVLSIANGVAGSELSRH